MYIVLALLDGVPAHREAGLIRDAARTIARPAEGLLHVFAQRIPGGAELALFIRAPTPETAARTGVDLCQRLCAQHLDGALLRYCEAVPVTGRSMRTNRWLS